MQDLADLVGVIMLEDDGLHRDVCVVLVGVVLVVSVVVDRQKAPTGPVLQNAELLPARGRRYCRAPAAGTVL